MTAPALRKGLLLLNVGTPEAPTPSAVRRFLRQFLSDGRMLDMNPLGRWLLLNAVILPFRPRRSAEAYRKIWRPEGSPFLLNSEACARAVREALTGEMEVAVGMRYGKPSIESALAKMAEQNVH